MKEFVRENEILGFWTCSAKDAENIHQPIYFLLSKLVEEAYTDDIKYQTTTSLSLILKHAGTNIYNIIERTEVKVTAFQNGNQMKQPQTVPIVTSNSHFLHERYLDVIHIVPMDGQNLVPYF